jgi:hypothetical protein
MDNSMLVTFGLYAMMLFAILVPILLFVYMSRKKAIWRQAVKRHRNPRLAKR